MDLSALQHLLGLAPGRRVACVGDLMVDRFVYGEVNRVSPEAPVPVLARSREVMMLGAAGNVARNVGALGGEVSLVGLIGGDAEGKEALRLVEGEPGVEGYLVTDADRPTTLKTRFASGGQQLLRVDLETNRPVSGEIEQRLVRTIRDAAKGAGAILLSDYGKGVVTEAVIAVCREAAAESGGRLVVDSKARSFARYGAVDMIKPNAAELGHATDLPTETDDQVAAALLRALELWEAKAILVTRASKGISLAIRGEPVRHFPTAAREVFDSSGAGDTTLAALGLALAAEVAIEDAIAFAQLASGVAVGKVGTATVSPDKLIEAARPDVLVKGADYAESEVVGGDLVKSWGGEVKLAPIVEGYSTTAAIAKMSRKASA